MNVLFISNSDDKFGAPKSMLEMIKVLQREQDITPIVLTPTHNNINKICDQLNIENYSTKYYSFMYLKKSSSVLSFCKDFLRPVGYTFFNKVAIKKINNAINLSKVDLVHTNISIMDIGAEIGKKYDIPHVWHLREFGQEDFNLKSSRRRFIHYMNKNTNQFFAISEAVKKSWVKKGIQKEKIQVIYNGINKEKFSVPREQNSKKEKLRLVFSGSLAEHKGQINLLEALTYLPKEVKDCIQVDFIGSGAETYEVFLKEKVQRYRLEDNINFLGYKEDIYKLLPNYDIGIVCSKSEGFGRVTVEYMMAGLCVIVSNTGANEEIVDNQKNGLVYKYNDNKDLAEKIKFLYYNQVTISDYGILARKKAVEEFTSEMNANEVYKSYNQVLLEEKGI